MSRSDARATGLYRTLIWMLTPVLLAHVVVASLRGGGWRHFRERLGFVSTARRPTAWLHAASVGEVQTVWPLVEALARRLGDAEVVVSTGSVTGANIVAQRGQDRIRHVYLPIDHPLAVRRFLRRLGPRTGWIVETEIWPGLYAACARLDIPLGIVNGRLSDKTYRHRRGLLAATFAGALASVRVLARTPSDAERFGVLGARVTEVVGNLKFVDNRPPRKARRLVERPYALVASTHDDEEVRFASAWLASGIDVVLVIAPRHPDRAERLHASLCALLRTHARASDGADTAERRIDVPRRSRGDALDASQRIYLADTLGELQDWYAAAATCAVGGSWVPVGGHNLLEPARHGRAPIVGPHLANVPDLASALREIDALLETDSVEAAVAAMVEELRDPDTATARGRRAATLAASGPAILERYLAHMIPDGALPPPAR